MKTILHQKKDDIQKEARDIWQQGNSMGLLAMATGSGKSKIAIDESKEQHKTRKASFKAILIVPTEKLRDVGWKDEYDKWGGSKTFDIMDKECYASIAKIKGNTYDFVILDEAHYITTANSVFFKNNTCKSVMALTATPPEDPVKQLILDQIAPIVYIYTLDQAVKDGLVAPFHITVIEFPLDATHKTIKSGTKAKPFYQTEKAKYEYLTSTISKMYYAKVSEDAKKFAYLNRMRFIYNLPSKVTLAKKMIKQVMKGRYLVFGGSIAQIEELMKPHVFHSKSNDKYYKSFMAKKTHKLGAVKALNEGQNFPDMDMILVVQLNSRELDIIQRIGRAVRWRKGHRAEVYILIASGTQDEVWLQKALQGFDNNNVTFKKAYQL